MLMAMRQSVNLGDFLFMWEVCGNWEATLTKTQFNANYARDGKNYQYEKK